MRVHPVTLDDVRAAQTVSFDLLQDRDGMGAAVGLAAILTGRSISRTDPSRQSSLA